MTNPETPVSARQRIYNFAAVRLNLDVELRYRAVQRVLKPLVTEGMSVLEVGAGAVSIGRYLQCPTTAVDSGFDLRRNSNVARVQASACSLPFADKTWDIVCSIDVPPAQRGHAIAEMVRVGKRFVAVALPVGQAAYRQDVWTHEYYIGHHGNPHRFALEHVELGLPDREYIKTAFQDSAKRTGRHLELGIVPNVNLSVRAFYMRFAFHGSVLRRALYVGMFPLAYFGAALDRGACYRDIFIARLCE